MRKPKLPRPLMLIASCMIVFNVLLSNLGVAAQPAPVLNRLLPRCIPSTVGYVLLEGNYLGTNMSEITVTFSSDGDGVNVAPCTALFLPFPSYLNCSLSSPNALNNSAWYNISVSVGQKVSNRLPFQTGVANTAPYIQDADIIVFNRAMVYIYIQTWEYDEVAEARKFLTIKPPQNGTLSPSVLSASTGYRVFSPTSDGRIQYFPAPTFIGRDSFQIQALDAFDTPSFTATINISIPRIRGIHAEKIGPIPFSICSNSSCLGDSSDIMIKSLPRGRLRLINGSSSVEIDSAPYAVVVDTSTQFEYIPPQGADYMKTSMIYANLSSDFDTMFQFYVGPLRSYDFQVRLNESTRTLVTLKCDFPINNNMKLTYRLEPDLDDSKGVFTQYNDGFTVFDNLSPILNGTRLRLRDEYGRMYFTPRQNYTGIFDIRYFCTDPYGRVSPTAKVTIAVKPVLQCRNKTDIQNALTLTNRNIGRDGISFRFLSTPDEGIFLHPGINKTPIVQGDLVNATTVQYITNITGASIFGGNLTYAAVNRLNDSSDPCTVQFVVSCAPLYLNVFDPSTINTCIECPFGAVCSFNGDRLPHAAKGYWYNDVENIYLACIPASACPGEADQICAEGYKGTRCGECAPNFYKLNNQCIPCGEIEAGFVVLVIACLASGIYLLYMFWNLVGKVQGLGIVNITCNFIQTTLILRNINMNWPPEIQDILDYFSIFNFNLELSSPECLVQDYLGFSTKMKFALCIPLVLCGFFIITIICRTDFVSRNARKQKENLFHALNLSERLWMRKLKTNSKTMSRKNQANSDADVIILFNAALSLVYITVSSYSLALFDCTKERDGFYYLDSDPGLRCHEDWWYSDLKYAILALIFYVVGIPCYFGIILYFSRNDPFTGRFWIRLKKRCSLITLNDNSYKPNRKEFTFFQIFQKLVLVTVSMFFTRYISFQIILIVYMLMIAFYVTAKFRPYVHESLNYLEIYSLGSNIVILTLGLLFYNNQLTPVLKAAAIDVVLAIIFGFIVAMIFVAGFELKMELQRSLAKWKSSSNLLQGSAPEEFASVQKTSILSVGLRSFLSTSKQSLMGWRNGVNRNRGVE